MRESIVLAVAVLAAMRLTRLINSDTILDPFRIAAAKALGPASAFLEWMGCPWCAGLWISVAAAVPPVLLLHWKWWAVPALGLAISQIVGMTARWYNDDPLEFEPIDPVE